MTKCSVLQDQAKFALVSWFVALAGGVVTAMGSGKLRAPDFFH